MYFFVGNICKQAAPGLPLHAETDPDPTKSHALIRILWDRTTADALAP